MFKIEQIFAASCDIIGNHEVEKAYSPTGAISPVPHMRCGPGREMRTQYGTSPNATTSRPTLTGIGLSFAPELSGVPTAQGAPKLEIHFVRDDRYIQQQVLPIEFGSIQM